MNIFLLSILVCLGMLSACSSVSVKDYSSENPVLRLDQYLNGNLDAYGIFQDRSGKIVKRFEVKMKATWTGNSGVLEEDFIYSDGSKSRRVWYLTKDSENIFSGMASDVVGKAVGEQSGNAFRWKYTMDLPVDDKNYHVQFDDWMFLMNDKIMINKSKMYKFGIYLGEVTLTFVKR